jgi:large subunit ribosomal protein L4
MQVTMTTLDGKEAGVVELPEAIFGLTPRPDIIQRCVVWQLSRRQRGTHAVKNRAEIARTGKKIYRQKGTGGARHGSARANLFRGGGRSFGPQVRSHAIDLPKKVRALALKHALSAKAQDGGVIVLDKAAVADGKTKALKTRFAQLGLDNALIIDGAEPDPTFSLAARNIPNIDVLPVQGLNVYDILRRTKLVLTKAALDYDVILGPVITEKATNASEHNQVLFKVRGDATKPQIKEAVEKLFDVKVKSVNTLIRKGKVRRFRGKRGQLSDVKKAFVTLEEGHRIDVATGL